MHVLIGLLLVTASSCLPAEDLDGLLEHLYGKDNFTEPPVTSAAELLPVQAAQPEDADKVSFPDETNAADVVSFPTDDAEVERTRRHATPDMPADSRNKCTVNGVDGECVYYYKCQYNDVNITAISKEDVCPSYLEVCCPSQMVS